MARLNRGAVWLVLASLLGCSQIVDFDRSKINADAEVDTREDSGSGTPDAGNPGRMDGSVADARVEIDADFGDAALPESCTGDRDCGSNAICCDGFCKDSSPGTGCVTCGGESCGAVANICNLRACSCGGGDPCSGAEPFCEQVPGGGPDDYRCVACREDLDCGTGKVCVDSACRPCDSSKGNTGCTNPTPICAAGQNTCVACNAANPCPAPLTCSGGACFGCVDGTNDGCDEASTAPICDPISAAGEAQRFQCEQCANDAECVGNPTGARCIASGACKQCDPDETTSAGNPACTDPRNAYCSRSTYTCSPCSSEDCTGATNSCAGPDSPAPLRGRCVQCDALAECLGSSPTTPQCNLTSGVCGPCTGTNGELTCLGIGQHCGPNGACVQCADNNDCGGNTPFCSANRCVGCAAAGGNAVCGGNTPACGADGRCGFCNPSTNFGCGMGNGNRANPYCNAAGTACVACTVTCADDNNACTTSTCANNVCMNTPLPIQNDNDLCTTDGCNPASGAATHVNACTAAGATVCAGPLVGCRACNATTNAGCTAPATCSPSTYMCVDPTPMPDAGMVGP